MKNRNKKQWKREGGSSHSGALRVLPIIAAAVASSVIQPAFAVDRTWFGGTGDWDVARNWTPNGVPGIGDSAIINGGNSTLSSNAGVSGLELSGGVLAGSGNLTLSGASAWAGGGIAGSGTTTFEGTLEISGSGTKSISGGRTVNANDTTTWSGNTLANGNDISFGGGTFNNTGTFTDSNAFSDRIYGNGTFNNSGTYNKQSDTLTQVGAAFNNTGTVNINAGTLRLQGNDTQRALVGPSSFFVAAGSTLDFNGGTHNLGWMELRGEGALQISGGTVNFNVVSSNPSIRLLLSGGTLTDSVVSGSEEDLTNWIYAATTWTSGNITGDGRFLFDHTLDIVGDETKNISGGREVTTLDTTTWSGNSTAYANDIFFSDGTFNNWADFYDTNAFNDRIYGSGILYNLATFNKQNDTLTRIEVSFQNLGGTINVSAGTLEITSGFENRGVINVAADAVFQPSNGSFTNEYFGIVQGNGTIRTNELVNSSGAHINPGDNNIGHLIIDGNLSLDRGVINLELEHQGLFDQLTVTGDVMLGGELAIWNLGYTPVVGDTFVILTFDERLADSSSALTAFSHVSVNGFHSWPQFEVLYHQHDVTLKVTAVPEPEHWAMLLAGLGLIGGVIRRRTS